MEVVSNPSRYLVNFLSEAPDPELAGAAAGACCPEAVKRSKGAERPHAIEGARAYVWSPDGVKAMTLSYAYLEKRLGVVPEPRRATGTPLERIVAKF